MVWSRLKASWAFMQTNHYAHLATKPLQSLLILAGLQWGLGWSLGLSAGLSLVLPAAFSGIRKSIMWTGSMGTTAGGMDLVSDTVAAASVIIPLMVGGFVGLALFLVGAGWLFLMGGHKHSLP